VPTVPIERIVAANVRDAQRYLARAPFETVFLSWLIASGRVNDSDLYLSRADDQTVDGVCLFGGDVSLHGEPDAVRAFGAHGTTLPSTRLLVGPKAMVDAYWAQVRVRHAPPTRIRTRQPHYVLERETLIGSRADAPVARATRDELDEFARASAAMVGAEMEIVIDPTRPSFRGRVEHLLGSGSWWRYRDPRGGELRFSCTTLARTPYAVQIEEVWTPPHVRGYGYATRGLAAICDMLLDEHPALCLIVNDFNTAAISLYERVGFRRVGEFSSYLFF